MKPYILLFSICLLRVHLLFAQNTITVQGQVTDAATGQPLIGAGVAVKGTAIGAQTDANGSFTVTAPAGGTLVADYLGYERQEVPINSQITVNLQLAASAQQLEQVVVVGYGTQQKRDVTGAISKVDGAELTKQPVQTPTQAIQGKVSGVQIISSGQPNAQPQVRIRGTGSTLGGVNPLYVVDGVLTDDIRNINNSDIVSMDILKDASASIYGVRAANGVIIITTKKGKAGEIKVSYDGNAGFRQATNMVEMAGQNQYTDYLQVAAPGKFGELDALRNQGLVFNGTTNWFDQILRNGFYTNHNLSVSGGSQKQTFYYSAGYFKEDGIIKTNNFERFNFRANNDVNIAENLTFTSQLSYSGSDERGVDLGGIYTSAYRAAPIVPAMVGDKYGNPSGFGNVGNPLLSLDKRNNKVLNNRLLGNIGLTYSPVKFLKLQSSFNADLVYYNNRTYLYQFQNDGNTFSPGGGTQRNPNSRLDVDKGNSLRWVWNSTATWDQTVGDHHFTILAGTVAEQFSSDFIRAARIDVPASEDQWFLGLGNPDVQSTLDNGGDKFSRQSFVGRINYDFAGRYLLSASLRADGSSKFSDRWGYFPTVGLGWVLSDESFMQNQTTLNFMKLRASWGLLGNDNIASNLYTVLGRINVPYFYNNGLVLGTVIEDIKDKNLSWETIEQYDIGLEFVLLNNKLSGEADFYDKKTKNALAFVTIPAIFGDPDNQYVTNVASFRNRGFELSLNWEDELSSDVSYRVGGNMTFNRNEVLDLAAGQAVLGGGVGQQGFVTRTDQGHPIGSFYVLDAIGVFQTQEEIDNAAVYGNPANVKPSDLKYRDINNDKVINDDDKIYAGSYQPKFYYGFNLGLDYRNFDLSADFYGNAGNKIYNGKKAFRYENTDNIEASFADNRWTPTNSSNTDPQILTSATPASTYFVESGSFLRLNNLTLGYTLPSAILERLKIENIRIYATSQNLFTSMKYSGFSPEILSASPLDSGIELNAYPTTRTFAFGVNIGF